MPFPLATGREAQEHMENAEGSVVFQHACNMLSGRGWARAIDPDARRLAQVQEHGGSCREAGGGGGVGTLVEG